MAVCARCGEENPGRARFCLACGERLGTVTGTEHEHRKLASLLFCDVVGSTELGEGLDPEVVRAQMGAYFALCRSCIAAHGGTVEKFIGDAVMAVFGVPVAHEDDAVRAVRASAAIQRRLAETAEESSRRLGRPLRARIGVATGEVVAGEDTRRMGMVTGDAVNTAARLEQAAVPGQVLVDGTTARLVMGTVECSPAGELSLKGKASPVEAFSVPWDTDGQGRARSSRRPGTGFVGRAEERALLRDTFERVAARGRGELVTVVGEAGVGKSRLVEQFLGEVSASRVIRGSCPPYGEGMTYYALRELLVGAGLDLDSVEGLTSSVVRHVGGAEGPPVAHVLAQALSMSPGVSTPEDIGWAVRTLLTHLAARGPVVVVVDDVQWAEPAFADLLRSAGERQAGPVLWVCLARVELLEHRFDWPGVRRLEVLTGAEVVALARTVLGGALEPGLEKFLVARSGGNPLFAQELAEMLRAEGLIRQHPDTRAAGRNCPADAEAPSDGQWVPAGSLTEAGLPTTLAALLGARLDRTPAPLRRVMECGSVEGEVFHTGAVARLAESERVEEDLSLLRRDRVVVPELPAFTGETAYRFHHLLLRDAAYRGLPKRRRADLHARFADWVSGRAGEQVAEFEELVAYHLEQALTYRRATSGPSLDDDEETLRIGRMLHRSGVRAAARGDAAAAVKLLSRADGYLDPVSTERTDCLLALAQAHWDLSTLSDADDTLTRASNLAADVGDPIRMSRAEIERARLAFYHHPEYAATRAARVLDETAGTRITRNDETTWSMLCALRCEFALWTWDLDAAEQAWTLALESAQRSGDVALLARTHDLGLGAFWAGASNLDASERRFEESRAWAGAHGLRRLEGAALACLAWAAAERGEFDAARRMYADAETMLLDTRAEFVLCLANFGADIPALEGDLVEAERRYRAAMNGLESYGDRSVWPTKAAELGLNLYRQGRLEEAYEMTMVSERNGADGDVTNDATWWAIRALVLAQWGRADEASALADRALAFTTRDDRFSADQLCHVGETYLILGEPEQAVPLLRRALSLTERGGFVVAANQARELLRECEGVAQRPGHGPASR